MSDSEAVPDTEAAADAEAVPEQAFEEELEAEVWDDDLSGPSLVARMAAEALGTFILVFLGVGTAIFFGTGSNGTLTVAFGFAIGALLAIVIVGGISGAHINPAVTVGVWLSGRFPGADVVPYIVAQVVGAITASAVLFGLSASHPQITAARELMSAGANGVGENSPVGFPLLAGLAVEIIVVAILVAVVLSATSVRAPASAAPFAISLAVGFLVFAAIPFTNGAINPARASGAALFSEPWALQQLWVFWVAPLIGAIIAGLLFRVLGPEEDLVKVEVVEVIED